MAKRLSRLTLYNAARIVAAIILLQTLFFKFTGHPESVTLFTDLGMEPTGRVVIGVIELIVGLLLLFGRSYVRIGALGGIALMIGAMYFHIAILGIDQLFGMAIIVLICCAYVLYVQKRDVIH